MDQARSPASENGYGNGYPHYPGRQPYMRPGDPEENEINLEALFMNLLKWKWTVVSMVVLGLIAGSLYVFTSQPTYESEGTVVITENQSRSTTGGSDLQNLLNTTYGVGMGSTVSNELMVLQSRRLAEALADKMLEQEQMENGRRFPLLWREYNRGGMFPYLEYKEWEVGPLVGGETPGDSTIVTREQLTRRIRNGIQAERAEEDANVVRIAFESPSPNEAKWMVDQIIDTYIEISGEQNRQAASAALEFLEEERAEVEQRLAQSEQALEEFMNESGLVQVDAQTQSTIERISDLESRRQEIQTNLVSINSGIETYEQQLDSIRPGLAERFSENVAPTLERYQFQLAELETERLMLITRNPRLKENPGQEPQLVEINNQIESLKEEISNLSTKLMGEEGEEFLGFLSDADGNMVSRVSQIRKQLVDLRLERAQALAQQKAIDERLSAENQRLDNLPENMTQLARLRRDVQISEQLYESVTQQYSETSRWEQTQYGRGRPLDYGTEPNSPVWPRVPLILLIGLGLGGAGGIGLALGREQLNNQIDGAAKLKQTGKPLLTVVPEMEPFIKEQFGNSKRVSKNGATVSPHWMSALEVNSPVTEAYRRLQNNIIYSDPDEDYKTILITSTAKGEGKTTTAVNLATVLGEAKEKVLLVDCDLRLPFVHHLTGQERSPGIMEVLFDDVPVRKAIKSAAVPNVDVLLAGRRSKTQKAIISYVKKLREIIDTLKEEYDHIVLDTAPYGVVTDAAPLMDLADGVVVIARFAETRFNELNQTLENLKRIRGNVIGTVLTRYRYEDSADYYTTGQDQYYYSYRAYEDYRSEIANGEQSEDGSRVEVWR